MSRSEHNPKRALTRRAAGAVLAAACLLAGCSSGPGDASTAPEALESSPVETAAATTGQATTAPATTAPAMTAPATEEADTAQAETNRAETAGTGGSGGTGIEEVAVAWYALADPAVCERMTGRMLELGWGARGQRGRRLCRTNVDDAEPVEDVVVGEPELAGAEASVRVEYTVAGDRAADRIDFVRRDGVWLIDSVRLDG